jgi:hypothetical protein
MSQDDVKQIHPLKIGTVVLCNMCPSEYPGCCHKYIISDIIYNSRLIIYSLIGVDGRKSCIDNHQIDDGTFTVK